MRMLYLKLIVCTFGLLSFGQPGNACPLRCIVFDNLNFDPGKSTLSTRSVEVLDQTLAFLQAYPQSGIILEGHCDDVESPANDLSLSLQRAEAARKYLVSKGISPCRIRTKSYGRTEPEVPNVIDGKPSRNNRALNRRVAQRVWQLEFDNLTSMFLADSVLIVPFEPGQLWPNEQGLKQLNAFKDALPRLLETNDSVKIEVVIGGETYEEECRGYSIFGCVWRSPCDSLYEISEKRCNLRSRFVKNYLRDLQVDEKRLFLNTYPMQALVPNMQIRILHYKCFQN